MEINNIFDQVRSDKENILVMLEAILKNCSVIEKYKRLIATRPEEIDEFDTHDDHPWSIEMNLVLKKIEDYIHHLFPDLSNNDFLELKMAVSTAISR